MNKRSGIIAVLAFFLILSAGGAYIARGWLRGSVIPGYASLFYKPALDRTFNANFSPVNDKLRTFGLSFATPIQDECWSGSNAMFQGFTETVPCIKQQENVPFAISSTFISQWQTGSPEFEHYLESSGWQKQYNVQQSIKLFSDPGDGVSVNYTKGHGKAYCTLTIGYSSAEPSPHKMSIDEACERDVSFFGGSSG